MKVKKMICSTLALVTFSSALAIAPVNVPLMDNPNSIVAEAATHGGGGKSFAKIGDIKTVTTYITASQIKQRLNLNKSATSLIEPFNAFASGAIGVKAKSALQGGVYGFSTYAIGTGLTALLKQDTKTFQAYLNKVKQNKAKGIVIKQKFYYTYVSKGKLGWVLYGKPSSIGTY